MKNSFIIYILFIMVSLVTGLSANSQDQKKPSERSFAQEISKIKQIQKERAKLIEQTKTQTAENTSTVPVNTQNQNPIRVESSQRSKPSSGAMRKTQKPNSSKG